MAAFTVVGRPASGSQAEDLPVIDDPVGAVLDALGTDCFAMGYYFVPAEGLRTTAPVTGQRAQSLEAIVTEPNGQLLGRDRTGAVWLLARSDGGATGQRLAPWTDAEGNVGWRIVASVSAAPCREG